MPIKLTECFSREGACIFSPPENSVLISITDPGTRHNDIFGVWGDVYRDQFWDVEKLIQGYSPATEEQLKGIWTFIQKYWDWNIYAHCEAGISRSGAVREYLIHHGWIIDPQTMPRETIPNKYILSWLLTFD